MKVLIEGILKGMFYYILVLVMNNLTIFIKFS